MINLQDNVYELRVKLYTLRNIDCVHILSAITNYIDSALMKSDVFAKFHQKYGYKYYCYDFLKRDTKDLQQDVVYVFQIRTVDVTLCHYFNSVLQSHRTNDFQGIAVDMRTLQKKMIECVYTLTPAMLWTEKGYWMSHMTFYEYVNEIAKHAVCVYNSCHEDKLPDDFQFFTSVEKLNQKPIACRYKHIYVLGDKFTIQIKPDELSQKLAYFLLGVGLMEKTSRGFGFLNYRWL